MLENNCWTTIGRVAHITKFSWNTVDKYIKRFYNRGWISKNRGYWRAKMPKKSKANI